MEGLVTQMMIAPADENRKHKKAFYFRVIAVCAVIYALIAHFIRSNVLRIGYLLAGMLEYSLTIKEKESLTLQLYSVARERFEISRGLFAWEKTWFSSALPPVPANILITAAGRGREAAALLDGGYSVDAAEPLRKFAIDCAVLPGIRDFFWADHDAVTQGAMSGSGPAAALKGRNYDAVIVGWGSLSHMISRDERKQFLKACHLLAPEGPVLISFFSHDVPPMPNARFLNLGRSAGRRIGRMRGVDAYFDPDDMLNWDAGFFHRFSEAEINALAGALGRRALFAASPYGHATLLPPAG
jgi:hypothetical protein